MHTNILQPVVVLVLWTLVMLGWLIVVRMPAMKKIGVDITKVIGGRGQNLEGHVPERVQWPAHNYAHLMEQPTLFYAIAISIAVFGAGPGPIPCSASRTASCRRSTIASSSALRCSRYLVWR